MERSHLSDLMANVQKMHNDLERSGENDRRRLESQIQMLQDQTYEILSEPYSCLKPSFSAVKNSGTSSIRRETPSATSLFRRKLR